ncbi:MAG: hypothetical protein JO138_26770 [Acidobacteriaceae bacterium]|nr:hypothetical protein [Acidobacteriaceae bacterium]
MLLLIGGLLTLLSPAAQEPQAYPKTMTKIVVRLIGPGIKPGSFAALPRTIYSSAPHYARVEDPPDAKQHVHKLTIIAEPDAYSLNLIDREGTHAIDQGGPNDLHLPIVLPFDPNHELPELDDLEFGDELHFFKQAGASRRAGPIINGKPTDEYVLDTANGPATLVVRSQSQAPVFLTWHAKDGTYKYEYIIYQELPFDPKLFAKPAGVRLKDIPPDNSNDR